MMKFEYILWFSIGLLISAIATAVLTRKLIPVLKSKKMGQKILDIGPRWHKSKEGTPTMGGLSFIAAITAVCILVIVGMTFFRQLDRRDLILTGLLLIYALLNGAIGFFDDLAKFRHGRNDGFTPSQKYLLQLCAAAVFLMALRYFNFITTEIYIPFLKIYWNLGLAYYILALILLTGFVNSVNLTDGLDGLAASVTFFVMGFFAAASIVISSFPGILFSGICAGGCLGFLVYNFYPAKIFMGDTGSLFLGAAVIGLAFCISNPLIVVVVGFVYLMETISVILQVLFFKLTGKRLFKMAPIHHHFEKKGFSEVQVVVLFSVVTIVFSTIAFICEYLM